LTPRSCSAAGPPSSRRVILADGSEVRAAGEVTLSYSLDAFTCARREATPAVPFTSTFIVTPLAPFELNLGIGWMHQHRTVVGVYERSIQLRVDGVGKLHCIRPLMRCNSDGSAALEAAPLQLKAIAQKRVCRLMRKGSVAGLYAVLIRSAANGDGVAAIEKPGTHT
jgi:hypothetical protein